MIPVTRPFLPPKVEFEKYVNEIWERNWLTNDGPLVRELESRLKEYLGVKHLLFVSNGTIALQIAIKALDLQGEIITTPFSYVATTSSIVWENCKPVFCDIDPETFNIDPSLIESKISRHTSAILATHVFGNPCDFDAIDKIARKHNLKVIYDGAHAFGTTYRRESVFNRGDITVTSFHATKIFHTIEGGAVIVDSEDLYNKIDLLRNFGHDGPEKFTGIGINGKNSEVHAAMGLCNLKYIYEILARRKEQVQFYNRLMSGLNVGKQKLMEGADVNNAYYPVLFASEETTLRIKSELEKEGISPRRYFYPSLSSLDYVDRQATPICDSISIRILCLPLYHQLSKEDQRRIITILGSVINLKLV
jgi:dTDP-4-amino-4,6-dideoxygalactose transaminase